MLNITRDFGQMNNLLETATKGARKQFAPIDLLDDTDDIAVGEWEKRKNCIKSVQKDCDKVLDLTPEDWIKLILYKNEKGIGTTKLFKELFLFCQRIDFIWDWRPFTYGPYSAIVEKSIDKLKAENIIIVETKQTKDKNICKLHEIKTIDEAEKLWHMLPDSFKQVISNITQEFEKKSYRETIHYVYSAYPEFAVLAKQ